MAIYEKDPFARAFGLPIEQIRLHHELTDEQKYEVLWKFGAFDKEKFMYAVKRNGELVPRRFAIKDGWRY